MKPTTIFRALQRVEAEMRSCASARGASMGGNGYFGILIADDEWARHYQKRSRQHLLFESEMWGLLKALELEDIV